MGPLSAQAGKAGFNIRIKVETILNMREGMKEVLFSAVGGTLMVGTLWVQSLPLSAHYYEQNSFLDLALHMNKDRCRLVIDGKLIRKFYCRILYSGVIQPSRVSFIENNQFGGRYGGIYYVDVGQRPEWIYAGGKCIKRRDEHRARVCWD